MLKKAKKENKPTEHELITRTPDWLDLPNPIVTDVILEHLEIDDYIRFSAVCKEWQYIQKEHRTRYSPYTPPLSLNFPWLRFKDDTSIYLFLPDRQNSYNIPLYGIPKCAYTIENKHGWLILLNEFFMSIFNPITGDQIELHPFFMEANNPIRPSMIYRVHLLPTCISSPLIDSECTILITDYSENVYLCQLNGNSTWKIMDYSDCFHFETLVSINKKIYDVSPCFERIYMVDTLLPDPFVKQMIIVMDCSDICDIYDSFDYQLVDFLGELVLVIFKPSPRPDLKGDDYDTDEKHEFHVYRADFLTHKWMVIKTLGDYALFFSYGSNFSLPADDVICMKNTIYFVGHSNGSRVAWQAFNLITKHWTAGPPLSPSLSSERCHRFRSWFLPTLDKWSH